MIEFTLTLTLAPTRAKRARRRPKRGKCGRWSVGTDLAARVSQYSEGFGELQLTGKWEVLKAIQNNCCYRTVPRSTVIVKLSRPYASDDVVVLTPCKDWSSRGLSWLRDMPRN